MTTTTPSRPEAVAANAPAASLPAARRRWVAVGLMMFALTAAVRVGLADRHGLWGDELFSLAVATGHSLEHPAAVADAARGDFVDRPEALAPAELARYAWHAGPVDPAAVVRAARLSDTSPPLYYLLLAYWTRAFGTGDVSLRAFSIACALAAVPLIWSLAGHFGGDRARVPTALLYAFTPLSLYFSTEGRMYSLLWLAAAANLWATVRLVSGGPRFWTFAAWVVTAVAGLYTHYFFTFVLAAAGTWMLVFPGRAGRGAIVAAGILAGVAAAPWYVHVPADMAAWRVTAGWQEWAPFGHHPVKALVRLPFHYVSISGTWGVRQSLAALNLLVYAALIVTVWWCGWRAMFSPRRLLLWAVAGAACAGLLASDLLRGTYAYTVERYVGAGIPAALVLVGTALGRLSPAVRTTFLVAILLGCGIGARRIYLNDGRQEHPVGALAAELRSRGAADDLVLVHSIPSGAINVARYLEAPDGSGRPAPPDVTAGLPHIASWVGQLGERRVPEDIARLTAGRRQVFYVRYHDLGAEPVDDAWLRANGRETGFFRCGKIPVVVYGPRAGDTF
ncbi:MAG TPA: glycosyltransferase family 39 protein [Tepidisphaeraceae bacterium]|nr:glycosyltransferase family 39 protein [Tepidisphaeraceae bacterium]